MGGLQPGEAERESSSSGVGITKRLHDDVVRLDLLVWKLRSCINTMVTSGSNNTLSDFIRKETSKEDGSDQAAIIPQFETDGGKRLLFNLC